MKYVLVAFWLIVMCGAAESQNSTGDAKISIGPWQIDATFTEERKLDQCLMSRTTNDGIEARFTREADGLSLVMTSPRWELEKGKTYPVEFAAGSNVWKADVTATNDAVPLNKSAAAFERLERCYQTNNKAGETNPFVAPKP